MKPEVERATGHALGRPFSLISEITVKTMRLPNLLA
jgi:hypothetical protein